MKAVAVSAFKTIPQVMDLPVPTPKEGQVLIQLAAAGLNPFDWKMVDGILDQHMPHVFPLILGVDGAGIVTATGAGVTHFKPGDRVYGQMLHAPVGEGSYAEWVAVPEKAAIATAPANIPLIDAAAAPTAGMTALQLLEAAGLSAGQTLLLIGATGGVGSFIVQLASARGIRVTASVSSGEGAERLKKLGVENTVNYREGEAYPHNVDGLIDLVNQAPAFLQMTEHVKNGGVVLTTQFVADKTALQARQLRGGNFETKGTPASLNELRHAIDSGALKIPVQRRITLEQAPAAIAESRELKSKGKTIIEINGEL